MMSVSESLQKRPLKVITQILLIIGALNWLSFGLQHKDLVLPVVGAQYASYVYILVGLAGVFAAMQFVQWVMMPTQPQPQS